MQPNRYGKNRWQRDKDIRLRAYMIHEAIDAKERAIQNANGKVKIKGKRAQFLEEYERRREELRIKLNNSESELEGKTAFESSYKLVNEGLRKIAFTPIKCLEWIGINAEAEILSAYRQNLNRAEAYQKAREINDRICGFEAISEDDVEMIIENARKKFKNTEGIRKEDDNGR